MLQNEECKRPTKLSLTNIDQLSSKNLKDCYTNKVSCLFYQSLSLSVSFWHSIMIIAYISVFRSKSPDDNSIFLLL